jgi:hypothetical protein
LCETRLFEFRGNCPFEKIVEPIVVALNSNEYPSISCRDGRRYVVRKSRLLQIVEVDEFELQVASGLVVRVRDLPEDVFFLGCFD